MSGSAFCGWSVPSRQVWNPMNNPSVTIGVTTYNAQDTILDALNSAVNQTVEIAQIIVVDDNPATILFRL